MHSKDKIYPFLVVLLIATLYPLVSSIFVYCRLPMNFKCLSVIKIRVKSRGLGVNVRRASVSYPLYSNIYEIEKAKRVKLSDYRS